MPLDLEIIRASEFIRVGTQGRLDKEASRTILTELAAACRKRGIDRALLDLRNLQPGPVPVLSRADLVSLVGTFFEVGFTPRQRVVVLYSADPHHRARMFAFLATMHGGNVKACQDFEEAIEWLSVPGPGPARPERGAKPVPIHVVQPGPPRAKVASSMTGRLSARARS